MIQTLLGPDPEGSVRYTRQEAYMLHLCDGCIHWKKAKGTKDLSCHAIVPPKHLCDRFKEANDAA